MFLKRLWNLVMAGILHAPRYCPVCGKWMKRTPAVEENFVRRITSFAMGSTTAKGIGRFGAGMPPPRLKTVKIIQVTPVYDVCEAYGKKIHCGSISTQLS